MRFWGAVSTTSFVTLGELIGLARGLAALADQLQISFLLIRELLGITDEQEGGGLGGEMIGSRRRREGKPLRIVAQGLEEALHDAYRSRKALRTDFFVELLDFSKALQSLQRSSLRRVGARTPEALQEAIGHAHLTITAQDAHGWFAHCGYDPDPRSSRSSCTTFVKTIRETLISLSR